MADIVIVNPSSNMRTVARELSAYGRQVECVRTSDVPDVTPQRIFYFFAGYNACFTAEAQGEVEKEERAFMFKRSLISRFRMWGVPKALNMLNPELVRGNFIDLMMFRRGMIRCDVHKDEMKTFPNVEAVCRSYPDSVTVVSALPGAGNVKLCAWETDFDLEETIGPDYFVFFNGVSRVEAFCADGKLITISKDKNHIEQLARAVPSLSRFGFNPAWEKNVMRNVYPWILKNQPPKVTVVNDYSFFGTSVDMQASWYGRLAAALNFGKTR